MNLRSLEHIGQQQWCFSLQQLRLYEPWFLRTNLMRRLKQGYIKHLTKWWYYLSSQKIDEEVLFSFSNTIYTPSYISMESALRFYDLIPEGVYMTTSCTSKKTQKLEWDCGQFYYYHIKPSLFRWYNTSKYMMAKPEKALCDFFYLKPHIEVDDLKDLRIDTNHLREITTKENLMTCANNMHNKRVQNIIQKFISLSS